jgi:hypothetical protein
MNFHTGDRILFWNAIDGMVETGKIATTILNNNGEEFYKIWADYGGIYVRQPDKITLLEAVKHENRKSV